MIGKCPILLAAFLLPAATASAQPRPATVRDSAGIRIMEHATIKNAPALSIISERASLDLGGLRDDPREEFDARQPMVNVARMSNGNIVANSMSDLKVFDSTGKFIRTIGRAGEGPGEFGQLKTVCVGRGDTIIAINYNRPRASIFSPAGEHVRSIDFKGYVPGGPCFADGSFLVRTNNRPNPATKFTQAEAAAFDQISDGVRYGMGGTPTGVVGTFADETIFGTQTIGNSFVQGAHIYAGDGRTAEVRILDLSGRPVRILRWNDPLVAVTAEMAEAEAAARIPTSVSAEERARRMEQARARPRPPFQPAYSEIIVDDAGRIWVRDSFAVRTNRGWTIFLADGTLLGRVTLPTFAGGLRPAELAGFMNGSAVLRWRDADGALHLTFHMVDARR